VIPPTINQENPDPDVRPDYVPNVKRVKKDRHGDHQRLRVRRPNAVAVFRRFHI